MKYIAMIQARCGSSRLPNKVLRDLAGKPDLQWVIERVRRTVPCLTGVTWIWQLSRWKQGWHLRENM